MTSPDIGKFGTLERVAVAMGRYANETKLGKRLQHQYLMTASRSWIRPTVGRRVLVDHVEPYLEAPSERGVVIAANHRSYFDAFIYMLGLYEKGAKWPTKIYFPVRANFFYETTAGVAVNFGISAGTMYPPIFRRTDRAEHNKAALATLARMLEEPGTLVGVHPEGTRNTGDPYTLLPAQPGVGQIVLQAHPMVIPVFVNGITNDFLDTIKRSFARNARRDDPIIVCFGDPLDYNAFATQPPRAALYKKLADHMNQAIAKLGQREKQLREQCKSGAIDNNDSRWLNSQASDKGN